MGLRWVAHNEIGGRKRSPEQGASCPLPKLALLSPRKVRRVRGGEKGKEEGRGSREG